MCLESLHVDKVLRDHSAIPGTLLFKKSFRMAELGVINCALFESLSLEFSELS